MQRTEVDAWVRQVVERVQSGRQDEDTRVELKGEWLAPRKAAKRLAGFANAARRETVLWLIGLTEEGTFTDPPKEELANWLPAVEKCFDELAPRFLRGDVVHVGDHVLFAIVFETDGAPYVLKGEPGQDDQRQVLWRRGNRTETARRQDLVRLLMPYVAAPDVEHRACNVHLRLESPSVVSVRVFWMVFITPPPSAQVWLIAHRSSFRFGFLDDTLLVGLPTFGHGLGGPPEAAQVATPKLVEVRVEDTLRLEAMPGDDRELFATLSIGLAHADPVSLSVRLTLSEAKRGFCSWTAGPAADS